MTDGGCWNLSSSLIWYLSRNSTRKEHNMKITEAVSKVEEYLDQRLDNMGQYHDLELTEAIRMLRDIADIANDVFDEDLKAELEAEPGVLLDHRAEEYISDNGRHCPFCKSSNLTADTIDPESMTAQVKCLDCKEQWTDGYVLAEIVHRSAKYSLQIAIDSDNYERFNDDEVSDEE